jgi:beta-ureidopropionase / N-carbamoyl-L-amino-acid hydrolase
MQVMAQSLPASMDQRFQTAIEAEAAARCPGKALHLPSGAGHDAQYLAQVVPAAMLFVPSIGGVSHHWTENTLDDDIVLGAQVFCGTVARILGA